MKYRDKSSAGRSKIAPYIHGEPAKKRHARRYDTAHKYVDRLKSFCEKRGIGLRVNNDGHHFIFDKNGSVAEWWPSSAKLVFNKQWRRGIHCHDYEQVIEQLSKKLS